MILINLLSRLFCVAILFVLIVGGSVTAMEVLSDDSLPTAAAAHGLHVGIVSGAVMELLMGISHCWGIRHRGFALTGRNLNVAHKQTMLVQVPYEQAFDLSEEALSQWNCHERFYS
ncbi:MAG: hypothetical protein BRC49_06845 [Cyanobacteria bacterium SW_10_48_33]|nr:MAG: hypothetical protein BRC49_06845 [Cyanobacteria bacterium SW_10_48_33]